jgi:carbamoyl-phosphate synthase large subunit
VSTDYDTSTRLYFEPLTFEEVMNLDEVERPLGVIVQLGGQTPLKLARLLVEAGVPLLGTSFDDIDRAENRKRFGELVDSLGLLQPSSATATSADEAVTAAETLGFPVLVRPSYVLGGRGMRVVYQAAELRSVLAQGFTVSAEAPVQLDKFLEDAIEVDVDALGDGRRYVVAAVMEHIEEAGIHSGDSSCVIPPYALGDDQVARITAATLQLAEALHVKGLLNVQFAVKGERIYVLEANPRASRTVPFVAKAIGWPLARLAALVAAGQTLDELGVTEAPKPRLVSIKKPVLPFARFPGEDAILGPEMKSTGEVMGMDTDFGRAFAKAQLGSGEGLPTSGTVFLSLKDDDKRAVIFMAKRLAQLGFRLLATRGTARFLKLNGLDCETVFKVHEGKPDVVDLIAAGEITLVINTPLGRTSQYDESAIRAAALRHGVPTVTTIAGALAAVSGIEALLKGPLEVRTLQETTCAPA